MSYTFTTFVSVLAERLGNLDVNDEDFQTDLPAIIDDAEQRIYRELDLLSTVVTDTSGQTTANKRDFTLPQSAGRFVVLQSINIFTAGLGSARQPLVPVSRELIDWTWPSDVAQSNLTIPTMFALVTDQTVRFGPPPGSILNVECIGTIRPTPLSSSNPTTFLTQFLSDLFLAAAMVSASGGLLQNFDAKADNPQMSMSWEGEYQKRFASANAEELRKKFARAA